MEASDLGAYRSVSAVAVSADGERVAYVVRAIDMPANRYRSCVWLASADGSSPPRQLTSGEADECPAFSPDGRFLAFASERGAAETKHSLHVLPIDGPGEIVTIGTSSEEFTSLSWAPDGRSLAYLQRAPTADAKITDDQARPPRRITRFFTRLDGEGWTYNRPTHLWVVPVDGSLAPTDLTPGEYEFSSFTWLHDGKGLVCAGSAHEGWDRDLQTHLHTVTLDGTRRQITSGAIASDAPSVSPDGTYIAFVGRDNPLSEPHNWHLGILDLGTGERHWLETGLDRTWNPYPSPGAPKWLDNKSLLGVVEDRGNAHMYRVPTNGAPIELVSGGDQMITAFDYASGTIAITVSLVDRPAELVVQRGLSDAAITVSDATRSFCAVAKPVAPERFTAGDHAIDVWVFLPPGYEPGRVGGYPMLLNIHGGPFTQYANGFNDEAQVQASAGYVVVMSNPRGGSGRDTAWARSIVGPKSADHPGTGWGSVDADDILTVLDSVLARHPAVDPARIGVIGGSYGGYLTSWLIAHSDRFAAACSERSVNNLLSEEWNSDIASAFRTEIGVSHIDDPEEYLRMSPIRFVHNIHTPLLIMHSEDDLRCPIAQAEELFVALRLLNRDVEFVRFPGEGHELSRSGSPIHRRQRFEIQLEFFGRHLSIPTSPADV
jgi:dipeptidyl aminopeptidase/acylaminoacyl peptidase